MEGDGAALGYAPTVANVATGLYRVTIDCTGGNGFEAGRRYSVYVAATVGGITGRDGIGEYEVLAVDINAALDVAISTRLAAASYTAPDNAAIALILADTDNIQTRLPLALVGGRMASNAEVVGDKADYTLTSGERDAVAAALLDLVDGIETGLTPRQALRVALAALAGKVSGASGTTVTFRNAAADSKDRIVATVDSDGNRSAVTLDLT